MGNVEEPRLKYGAIFKHCLILVKEKVRGVRHEIENGLNLASLSGSLKSLSRDDAQEPGLGGWLMLRDGDAARQAAAQTWRIYEEGRGRNAPVVWDKNGASRE